jgi:hypothetical protein
VLLHGSRSHARAAAPGRPMISMHHALDRSEGDLALI